MKPYKIVKNVTSSAVVVKETEVNVDTTFVNKGITKAYDEDGNHIGYNIATQEWWRNEEYIEKISQENRELKLELNTSNMELVGTIQAVAVQMEVGQAELMMEVAKTLEELQGGR